jgi:hypothetical protein
MWIGITGPAQSGKDTVYSILKEVFGDKCQRFSFADKLKYSVASLFDISREVVDYLKISQDLCVDIKAYPRGIPPVHRLMTMREILQRYGTEAHRNIFGKDFWVEQLFKDVEDDKNMLFVITDVRFDNEAKAIKDRKGFIIRLTRNGTGNMKHASEVPIAMDLVNVVINNDGSIEDLKNNILNVVKNNWISCE